VAGVRGTSRLIARGQAVKGGVAVAGQGGGEAGGAERLHEDATLIGIVLDDENIDGLRAGRIHHDEVEHATGAARGSMRG